MMHLRKQIAVSGEGSRWRVAVCLLCLALIAVALLTRGAFAEELAEPADFDLYGVVVDDASGQALVGAFVSLAGADWRSLSNGDGHFGLLDEMPVIGGLDYLESLPPHELYMVEVYGRGRHIRVYSNQFMERGAKTRLQPVPLLFQSGGAGRGRTARYGSRYPSTLLACSGSNPKRFGPQLPRPKSSTSPR